MKVGANAPDVPATDDPTVSESGSQPTLREPRPSSRSFAVVSAILLPALFVGGLFLAQFLVHDYVVPVGSDTAQAIWRGSVVSELGLDGLPPSGPTLLDASSDRPGLPVTMAVLHAATGIDALSLAFLLPAVIAAALALAAGAFAVAVLGEPRWAFPLYAILVGVSVNVELMAAGYFDNLFAAATLMAASVTVLLAVDGRRGARLSVVLLAGAALFHWMFAAFFVALLAVLWVGLVPSSLRARRAGTSALVTPAGRLATIVGAAAAIGAVGLAVSPNALTPLTGPPRSEVLAKLSRLAPVGLLLPSAALATVGAWFLGGTSRRRWGRVLLVLWAASAVVGGIIVLAGGRMPAHRLAAFSLAVPLLCAAGIVGIVVRVSRPAWASQGATDDHPRPPGARRIVAAVLAVGLVGGGVVTAAASWFSRPPFVNAERLSQVETIAEIVDQVGPERSVVLIADAPGLPGYGATPAIRRVRSVLDPARVGDVHVYVGDPQDLLARRATERPEDPAFEAASREVWQEIAPHISGDPVVVVSGLYDKDFGAATRAYPNAAMGQGLLVVGADLPPEPTVAPRTSPSVWFLVGGWIAVGLILTFVGLGWSWTMLAARAADRVALAPAIGLAVVAVAGVAADRLGLAVGAGGGIAVILVSGAVGWIPGVLRARRRARAIDVPHAEQAA